MIFLPMILRKITEQMIYQPRLIKNMVLYFIFKCTGEMGGKKCDIFTIVEKRKAENSIFIVAFFKKKNQRMR